ncbi:MAG: hypothetical protein HYX40_02970 [Sphingobacteriales bacterium]|nr:hypothetical protein [Sphingobacteriales bacterium]
MSEQLRNKILHMEVAPPAAAWDYIASQLDKTLTGTGAVQQKMNQLTVPPPAFIWNEIEKELDKSQQRIIPISRGNKINYWRYTAAAIFIGMIATGITLFLTNKKFNTPVKNEDALTKSDKQVIKTDNDAAISKVSDSLNTQPHSQHNISSTPYTSNRLPLNKQRNETLNDALAINDIPLKKVNAVEINNDIENPYNGVKIIARDLNGNIPTGINAITAGNDYFITTGPNGEVVRVSNKLANIIQLLGDENSTTQEYIDVVIKESAIWKQRFYNLRNKLSKIAPSPNNFLDIIQLTNALKEEKKP